MNAPLAFSHFKGCKLHLGVCGSVSAYKAVELMRLLQKTGIQVSVTLTEAASQFLTPLTFESLGAEPVYTRMFGQDDGISFGHLLPGAVADAFVVAPATATTLARIACGMADDMLAAQALAYSGPLVFAPAMNPRMWANPATQANVRTLLERGHSFVFPDSGKVACGDDGQGKLAEVRDIYLAALKALCPQDLAGKTVLLTLGPTREQWDGVRCWTNLSTGRMGASLVEAAFLRGASVHAVTGPGVPALPAGVCRYDVVSARQMFEAAKDLWPTADAGIFTAAVADFSPEPLGPEKFKKQGVTDGFSVRFVPNPDILATLAADRKPHQKVIGFAAETGDLEAQARVKLTGKKADMIVGNIVGGAGAGFAAETNTVFVVDARGREESWPMLSKADVAWRLVDWLLSL